MQHRRSCIQSTPLDRAKKTLPVIDREPLSNVLPLFYNRIDVTLQECIHLKLLLYFEHKRFERQD